jgi:hypothetical protein
VHKAENRSGIVRLTDDWLFFFTKLSTRRYTQAMVAISTPHQSPSPLKIDLPTIHPLSSFEPSSFATTSLFPIGSTPHLVARTRASPENQNGRPNQLNPLDPIILRHRCVRMVWIPGMLMARISLRLVVWSNRCRIA